MRRLSPFYWAVAREIKARFTESYFNHLAKLSMNRCGLGLTCKNVA